MSKLQTQAKKVALYTELKELERKGNGMDRTNISKFVAELGKQKRFDLQADIHFLIVHHAGVKAKPRLPYKGEKTTLGTKYDCNQFPEELVTILCNYIDVVTGKSQIPSLSLE